MRTTKRVVFFKLWVNFYGIRLSSTFFSLTVQCAHEQYQAWMDERNQKPYFFILFDSFCFIFCVRCAVIWEKLSPEVFVLGSWVPKTFNVKMYFADGNRIRILQYTILTKIDRSLHFTCLILSLYSNSIGYSIVCLLSKCSYCLHWWKLITLEEEM